jgi:hypothetical protein
MGTTTGRQRRRGQHEEALRSTQAAGPGRAGRRADGHRADGRQRAGGQHVRLRDGGNITTGSDAKVDWDKVFTATSTGATKANPLPAQFKAATFTRDFKTTAQGTFSTADDSIYATGSKDTLPISPVAGITGNWECKSTKT